jgi:hypothetical protein
VTDGKAFMKENIGAGAIPGIEQFLGLFFTRFLADSYHKTIRQARDGISLPLVHLKPVVPSRVVVGLAASVVERL